MEDLWRNKKSAVGMKGLADLAEYQRFLERFQVEEERAHKDNLLYGDLRLVQPGRKNRLA